MDRVCCKIGRVGSDGPDSNSAGLGGHVRLIVDFGPNDADGSTDRLERCGLDCDSILRSEIRTAGVDSRLEIAPVLWAARRPCGGRTDSIGPIGPIVLQDRECQNRWSRLEFGRHGWACTTDIGLDRTMRADRPIDWRLVVSVRWISFCSCC